jgi:hypothetical protein
MFEAKSRPSLMEAKGSQRQGCCRKARLKKDGSVILKIILLLDILAKIIRNKVLWAAFPGFRYKGQ